MRCCLTFYIDGRPSQVEIAVCGHVTSRRRPSVTGHNLPSAHYVPQQSSSRNSSSWRGDGSGPVGDGAQQQKKTPTAEHWQRHAPQDLLICCLCCQSSCVPQNEPSELLCHKIGIIGVGLKEGTSLRRTLRDHHHHHHHHHCTYRGGDGGGSDGGG